MNRSAGLLVVVAGVCIVIAGLLIYAGAFSWFGRLPGDIRYESDKVQVYVPVVSMLIVSVVLSLLFYLLRRFF
jgi:membrane protein implicated in regulation of membrane protease activity